MGTYRHYNELWDKDNEERGLDLLHYNRACKAVIEVDELARRLQKVKKVYHNEVETLRLIGEIATNLLEHIEQEKKEVGR